jgi:hypothetical protein
LLVVGLALAPRTAAAFTIASGFSQSCHERLGLAAMALLLDELNFDNVTLPPGDLWRDVAAELAPAVLETTGAAAAAALTDAQKFVLFSIVVGIRSPDTDGHSVSNLDALRAAQIDPDPDSQHLHCLRAPSEDGFAGDVSVLQGSEQLIRQEVFNAADAALATPRTNTRAPFYLDFYGQLEVDVDTPSYLIGRAMHTVQDCHAHTLRSADVRTVFTVLNYIDAVAGRLDEARDGMAHSDTLDDCRRTELSPVVERAVAVSSALARAAVALARTGDGTLLAKGFGACPAGETDTASCEWMYYQPACAPTAQPPSTALCCSQSNAYCGTPYLTVAREKLTRPYVAEILSCAVAPRAHGPPRPPGHTLAMIAGAIVFLRLLRGRRRKPVTAATVAARTGRLGLILLVLTHAESVGAATQDSPAEPTDALAERFVVAVEGHVSLLSDAPERSFINVTSGYALHVGYRVGRWGVLAQVERNYWLPTELSHELKPGALNIGVGGDWFAFRDRVRFSVTAGPSILWFDTAFDAKGSVGLFIDLRPAGLRWTFPHLVALVFDPLSLAIVAPVLGDPGILQLEYRTVLGVEMVLP